ncbi:MAG: sulfatase-like hydrolase/transferase, partial [Anaerolineales bacterium]|nr:sulfatase-like hydrolase/transferase [Anaerolineales bacterium]
MAQKPNFVIIYGETQGANVIGAYGYPGVNTPNTDKLAQSGILFTRGYTTCPLCTPARAGMFTGIYPHSTGAWTNTLPTGKNIKTMGQRFRDAGYRTAYTGKWHLDGHDYFGTGRCPDGWDKEYWYDGKRYLNDLTVDEIYLWRKGLDSTHALREHEITSEFTWGHRAADKAINFLKNRLPGDPFLLV